MRRRERRPGRSARGTVYRRGACYVATTGSFPIAWLRRVVRDRLGITLDEMDSGHTPVLTNPDELACRLEAYRADVWRSDETAPE